MPKQARHAAGLILGERGYRSVGGGPGTWTSTARRRAAQGAAGLWSGHFVSDAFSNAVFDITEWLDRDCAPPVVRYAYQVRYCSALHNGMRWQYRLDYHPLEMPTIFVPHYHEHEAREDEHDPRPGGAYLSLPVGLEMLEAHLAGRIGECAGEVPKLRGRAPYEPTRDYRRIS